MSNPAGLKRCKTSSFQRFSHHIELELHKDLYFLVLENDDVTGKPRIRFKVKIQSKLPISAINWYSFFKDHQNDQEKFKTEMYVIPGLGKGQHQVILISEVNTTSVLTIHFIPGDFNQFSRLFSLPVLKQYFMPIWFYFVLF